MISNLLVKKIIKIAKYIAIFFFASTFMAVIALRFIPVYITPLMVIRCVQNIGHGNAPKLKHHWVSLDEMSPSMPIAVMASEDSRFLSHHGFDFEQIGNAVMEQNRRRHKRRRGASTISQQTAKNVFLWPSSTWVRKGFEVYFTFMIELCWNKERIMEVYLNVAEMGKGIYGAEAAAKAKAQADAKAKAAAAAKAKAGADSLEGDILGTADGDEKNGQGLGSGGGGGDGGYGDKVRGLIEQNWRVDQSMNGKKVVVSIKVTADGTVTDESCQGDEKVCQSALDAIRMVGMFPRPPATCPECSNIKISMTPKL